MIGYIFRRSIPQNRQISLSARGSHARQSLHLKKIARTLNINICFENLYKYIYIYFSLTAASAFLGYTDTLLHN